MFTFALLATSALTPIDIHNDPLRFGYDKPPPGITHPARLDYYTAVAWRNKVQEAEKDVYSWHGRENQYRALLADACWRVAVWDAFDDLCRESKELEELFPFADGERRLEAGLKLRNRIGYVAYYLGELPCPWKPSDE